MENCLVCGKENAYKNKYTEEVWGSPVVSEYDYECDCGYKYHYMHGIKEHTFNDSRSIVTSFDNNHKMKLQDKVRLQNWRLITAWKKRKLG